MRWIHRNLFFSGVSVCGPGALDSGPCALRGPETRRAASVTVPSARHPVSGAAVGLIPQWQLHFGTVLRDNCAVKKHVK